MEEKTMTPEELDALPPGSVIRDSYGWDSAKGGDGRWYVTDQGGHDDPGSPPFTIVHPVQEPPHPRVETAGGWKQSMAGVDVELECDGDGTYWVLVNGKRLFGADSKLTPLGSGDCAHLGLIDWDTGAWWFETADPVPEPDHSMCARLVQAEPYADGSRRWWLEHPNGGHVAVYIGDAAASVFGYAIPDPEPTVVERAAKVLARDWSLETATAIAQGLADAGLLVRDGEQ